MHSIEQEAEALGKKQAEEIIQNKHINLEKESLGQNKHCNFEVKKVHYKNIWQTMKQIK